MNVKIMKNFAPKIFINIDAINKMKEYIRQSSLEIGWLGTARRFSNQIFIDDVFLFKQEVHSTTTEITTEGLNDFAMELLSQEDGVEIWNNMKVWGHSHVNMSTSPSSQDDKQIEVFSQNADDFFIRIIANKKDDFRIDLYDYTTGVIYEQLPYEVDYGEDKDIIESLYKKIEEITEAISLRIKPSETMVEEIKTEIKEKVTEKKFTYSGNAAIKTTNSWYDDYDYTGYGYYNGWSKKKEKSEKSKEENKITEYFDSLNEEDIFNLMYYMEAGLDIRDVIDFELTHAELEDLETLIEGYARDFQEKYDEYLGYVY